MMQKMDKEIVQNAKPFIIGIVAVIFAVTVKHAMPGYPFDRAEELWKEWEKRYLR